MPGVATLCFTDIVGSTGLLRAMGQGPYAAVLERHRDIIRKALAQAGGTEVSVEGDGFFLAFETPDAALHFATEAQRALAAERWADGVDLKVRIGVHRGPSERQADGDYVGLGVHRASRLATIAAGGQVLVTDETAADATPPADCRLRPLGRHLIRDFDGAVELLQLVGPGLPDGFPPLRAARATSGLPLPPTAFVGRDDELDAVLTALETAPVVTLVGPSGVGKSRLAIEAAALVAPDSVGGVKLVELSTVSGPHAVIAAVAGAVGVRTTGETTLTDALMLALRASRHLLLLDSCERVLDGVAEFLDMLARSAPKTAVLATSLEAIRVPGERVIRIGPLTTEDAAPAVRLLVDRIEAAGGAVDVAADAHALLELARRLDGIPLALELAGPRCAEIGLADVIAALDDRFALLTGGYRTAAPRHQSLEAAVAWSVDLLKPFDRALLAQLGRVLGRWRLEWIAELVDDPDTPDALQRLVEHSLVVLDANGVRLLDTIRDFVASDLSGADAEAADVRRAEVVVSELRKRADQPEDLTVDALRRTIADVHDLVPRLGATRPDLAAQLVSLTIPWFEWLGNRAVGIQLADEVLAHDPPPNFRAGLLAAKVQLLGATGNLNEAAAIAQEVVDSPDAEPRTRAIALLFTSPLTSADPAVDAQLAEAEELASSRSTQLNIAVRSRQALRAALTGDMPRAIEMLNAIIDDSHEWGFITHEAQALVNLGSFQMRAGQVADAETSLVRGEELARENGLLQIAHGALTSRATAALHRGDVALALELAQQRLDIADETSDIRGATPPLSIIATAAALAGDIDRALAANERLITSGQQSGEVQAVVIACFNLAVLASSHGEIARAVAACRNALSSAKDQPLLEALAVTACAGVAAIAGVSDAAAVYAAVGDQASLFLDPSDREWLDAAISALGADPASGAPATGTLTEHASALLDAVDATLS